MLADKMKWFGDQFRNNVDPTPLFLTIGSRVPQPARFSARRGQTKRRQTRAERDSILALLYFLLWLLYRNSVIWTWRKVRGGDHESTFGLGGEGDWWSGGLSGL